MFGINNEIVTKCMQINKPYGYQFSIQFNTILKVYHWSEIIKIKLNETSSFTSNFNTIRVFIAGLHLCDPLFGDYDEAFK